MINIVKPLPTTYPLRTSDLKQGHAYESDYGTIYICNPYEDVVAFSVCGSFVVHKYHPMTAKFREVNIEITVK